MVPLQMARGTLPLPLLARHDRARRGLLGEPEHAHAVDEDDRPADPAAHGQGGEAEERGDELKLVKVNIDEEQDLAAKYGIASIPTMILFRDGEPAASAVGAQPKGMLERSLGLASES